MGSGGDWADTNSFAVDRSTRAARKAALGLAFTVVIEACIANERAADKVNSVS
jgi:hypothetical protein